MQPLPNRLKQSRVLVADGAMGTMLQSRGLSSGQCPEQINLERPELLEEIARLYLNAGADIIQTNTFGASPLKLAAYSLADQTESINITAVNAVRRAVKEQAYVCASCGPCGQILKPYGDMEPEAVREGFRRQLQAATSAGVDMICIETMTDLNEARLAIQAARAVAANIPVCATMTFDPTPKGFFTIMGVSIEQAARELAEAGADMVGSNCGNGIVNMTRIAAEFKKPVSYTHLTLPTN